MIDVLRLTEEETAELFRALLPVMLDDDLIQILDEELEEDMKIERSFGFNIERFAE